jgi:hypothetical protein
LIPTPEPDCTVACVDPVTPPSVAVIVTVPGDFAVTFPLTSTLATLASLALHCACAVTSCVVLSEYVPVAVNCTVAPAFALGFAGVTAMLWSVFGAVTVSVAPLLVTPPCAAVIVVVPVATPVARP